MTSPSPTAVARSSAASASRSRPARSSGCWAERRRQDDDVLDGGRAESPDSGRVLLDGTTSPTTRCTSVRGRASATCRRRRRSSAASPSSRTSWRSSRRSTLDGAERRTRLRELLAELGLTPLAKSPAYTLSGGERRRRDHAGARHLAHVHAARRAVRRHRPHRRHGHPEDHLPPQGRGIGVLITDHRQTLRITDRAYIVHDGVIFRRDADSLARRMRT